MLKNSESGYGWVHRLFHWIMAILIVGMLCVGLFMADLNSDIPDERKLKILLTGLHKATGMLVLSLVLLRLIWRWANTRPPLPDSVPNWQRIAARVSHVTLYLLMLAMPVTGYLMSSFAGRDVDVYGLFTIPGMFERKISIAKQFHEIHEVLASVLIALLVVHAAAAIKHHFYDKDRVLRRMLTGD